MIFLGPLSISAEALFFDVHFSKTQKVAVKNFCVFMFSFAVASLRSTLSLSVSVQIVKCAQFAFLASKNSHPSSCQKLWMVNSVNTPRSKKIKASNAVAPPFLKILAYTNPLQWPFAQFCGWFRNQMQSLMKSPVYLKIDLW